MTFSIIIFFNINVYVNFTGLTKHLACVFFFIINNGRLAVIFLFSDRQVLLRHIPHSLWSFHEGMSSYFFQNKTLMHSYNYSYKDKKVPKNIKTILYLITLPLKLFQILYTVMWDCKVILTLLKGSLHSIVAGHILYSFGE